MGFVSLCEYCGRDMFDGVSCIVPTLTIPDFYATSEYERVVFGREERDGRIEFASCPDCAAPPGGLHHIGCDWEQCPRCGQQLLGCACDVQPAQKVVPEAHSRLQLALPLE